MSPLHTKLRLLRNAAAVALLAGGLAACGGGGGGGGGHVVTPPPPSLAAFFGASFEKAFNASAMSEPFDPAPGDIIALSLTTEPQPLH